MATTTRKPSLRKQSVEELFTVAFALTHRIHVIDKHKTTHRKGTPERAQCEADVAELRADRDRIVREVKRRCGER